MTHNVSSCRLLAVLTRNPVSGKVKTRLAAAIGNDAALMVYETLREYTAEVTNACNAGKAIFYSDEIPKKDAFLHNGTLTFMQVGEDFGARMHHTFATGFSLGFRQVVLIGTDCPDINAGIIDRAFSVLENNDAVLGPAKDGGFYLIGLTQDLPKLFADRTWSHEHVLQETIDILNAQRIAFELLPELQDIDTFDDLKRSRLWHTKEGGGR
ncbi:MAG: TIGR04282 family arsenosugar biosynthesis glycosyltransferase [Chlorobiaceae bacterium]|nr:TIGR04282 family arsenosugar biosynthesis glycosyltransferase [Chlorobiaceae bacterium]